MNFTKSFKQSIIDLSLKVFGETFTAKLEYLSKHNRLPDFENPKDLSEYILSIRNKKEITKISKYVDKVEVRNYIESKGLSHILLKHYGVWDKPEDIDFEFLPDKFILKVNNGSGNHVICKDKKTLDVKKTIDILNENLAAVNSIRELQYKEIPPKVFCEELIDTGTDEWPTDYKIMCFKGVPDHFFVATERNIGVRYITFDFDWNQLPYIKKNYLPQNIQPQKPTRIKDMVEYAKILSEDFDFVRVDFYEHDGKIYFSELTFTPGGGYLKFYNNESLDLFGKKMGLW